MLILNPIPAEFPFLDVLITDFERTWWKFFQKRVVYTKFDIYVLIYNVDNSHIR
jgi:hypothetical protein